MLMLRRETKAIMLHLAWSSAISRRLIKAGGVVVVCAASYKKQTKKPY